MCIRLALQDLFHNHIYRTSVSTQFYYSTILIGLDYLESLWSIYSGCSCLSLTISVLSNLVCFWVILRQALFSITQMDLNQQPLLRCSLWIKQNSTSEITRDQLHLLLGSWAMMSLVILSRNSRAWTGIWIQSSLHFNTRSKSFFGAMLKSVEG